MAQEVKVDVITRTPRDKALDEEACSRMVAENRISLSTLTMMEAVMKPPSRGATISLLARPGVLLAFIRATKQDSHAGGEKYENTPASVTVLYRAGVPILARIYAHA